MATASKKLLDSCERFALYLGFAVFLGTFVAVGTTMLLSGSHQISLDSLKFISSMISPIVGISVVALTYIRKRMVDKSIETRHWLIFMLILGVAFSYFAGEMSVIIIYTMSRSFRQLTLDPLSTALLLGTAEGLFAYILSIEIFKFNLKKLSLFSFFFVLTGFLVTGSYHIDPRWWAGSLCALGMGMGYTGAFYIYNSTVVITSLLLLLMGFYISPAFDNLITAKYAKKWQVNVLKGVYLLSIFLLFLVGLIPFGHGYILSQIHYFAGNFIFVFIGLTMLLLPLLLGGMKKSFYVFNYGILALALTFYILYSQIHYFTITFYEINSIILIVIWATFLVRNVDLVSS